MSEEKLSNLFNRLRFDITFVLCSITDMAELDAAEGWLKKHYPEVAPHDDFVDWLKKGITKYSGEQFSESFMERFPLTAKKLNASEGNKLIFLRMAEFCGADPAFLAEQIEAIIRARDVEGKQYLIWRNLLGNSCNWTSSPRNKKCFVLSTIAYYTQTSVWAFRRAFLPEGAKSGSSSTDVFLDWRSKEEQEKVPIWKIQ